MTHDPLCFVEDNPLVDECRICALIAKVREDERQDTLAQCIAAIQGGIWQPETGDLDGFNRGLASVVKAIRALQEQP